MKNNINYKEMQKVAVVTLIINIVFAAAKLIAGLIFKSTAVISDSVHTISDVSTTIIVLMGLKISKAPADKSHNYGHEKIEAVFSTLLAVILFLTAAFLLYNSISSLIKGVFVTEFNILLLIVTAASILSQELMYRYTMHYANKYGSQSLKADAWHHRSDSVSSIAVLIGLGGAFLFEIDFLEQIAAIIVSLLIAKVAVSIYLSSINKLIDKAADYETVKKMSEIVCSIPGVVRIDSLKTRLSTYKIYVDLEIAVDGGITLYKAHEIAQDVHDILENRYTEFNIKHINVHVNPLVDNNI